MRWRVKLDSVARSQKSWVEISKMHLMCRTCSSISLQHHPIIIVFTTICVSISIACFSPPPGLFLCCHACLHCPACPLSSFIAPPPNMPNREGGKKVRHRMLVGLVTAVLFSVLPYSPTAEWGEQGVIRQGDVTSWWRGRRPWFFLWTSFCFFLLCISIA